MRARLAAKKLVLEAQPGNWAFNGFAFENRQQVRQFLEWLESAKGRPYDRPPTPPFLHHRMRIEGRKRGLFFRWDHHPGDKDWGYTVYVRTADVDRFIHELMRLFIWQ